MVSDADVQKMCDALGLPQAELVKQGIRTTMVFFRDMLHVDPFDWLDYIRGIDFHKSVTTQRLTPGTRLSRHKSTGAARQKPFVYFTKPGTSPYRTGTSFSESEYELFETVVHVPTLISYASGIKFHPTDRVSRLGGGLQYILSWQDFQRLGKLQSP